MFRKFKFPFKKIKRPERDTVARPENHYDPVCGMLATGDFFVINYQEREYYFCSEYCKVKFASDPPVYVS